MAGPGAACVWLIFYQWITREASVKASRCSNYWSDINLVFVYNRFTVGFKAVRAALHYHRIHVVSCLQLSHYHLKLIQNSGTRVPKFLNCRYFFFHIFTPDWINGGIGLMYWGSPEHLGETYKLLWCWWWSCSVGRGVQKISCETLSFPVVTNIPPFLPFTPASCCTPPATLLCLRLTTAVLLWEVIRRSSTETHVHLLRAATSCFCSPHLRRSSKWLRVRKRRGRKCG